MLRILHASDLQVGKPFRPRAAEAFRRLAFDVSPHTIVVSGDLTQRAKGREFRAAWEFLKRMPTVPLIVTPGNHDVPLYRAWERIAIPWLNWRRFIPRDLDSAANVAGSTIVGLNSASPYRAVVNGRITRGQLAFARKKFDAAAPGMARILVVHHHFVRPAGGDAHAPVPRARQILKAIEEMKVDLVLGGHIHQTSVTNSRDLVPGVGTGVPLIATGTTTSRRGRGAERRRNSCNVVEIHDDRIDVIPHYFESGGAAFEPAETIRVARPGTVEPSNSAVSGSGS